MRCEEEMEDEERKTVTDGYYSYKRRRYDFGKHCVLNDVKATVLFSSPSRQRKRPPEAISRKSQRLSWTFGSTGRIGQTSAGTLNVGVRHVGNFHFQGTSSSSAQSIKKKDIRSLVSTIGMSAKSNKSVDIFNVVFDGEDPYRSLAPSVRSGAVFAHRFATRGISSIEWHPSDRNIFSVTHCDMDFRCDVNQGKLPANSYLWDVEKASSPHTTLRPPSPLCCLKFRSNMEEPNVVVGGCYNGLVSLFDIRRKEIPIESSVIELSHRDPVYDIAWRSEHLFLSVSSDGSMFWWDRRRLAEPVKTTSIRGGRVYDDTDENKGYPRLFARSMCAGRGVRVSSPPHDILVGTEQGSIVSVESGSDHAKDAKRSPRMSAISRAHSTSIVSVQRSPLCPQYFLSVGDWRAKVWRGDLTSPVLSTDFCASPMTAGCWSPTRPGVFYIARADGVLDVWDLHEQHHASTYSHNVGAEASESLSALSCAPCGRMLAVGTKSGKVHLLLASEGLTKMQEAELTAVEGALDREARCQKQLQIAVEYEARRAREIERVESFRAAMNERVHTSQNSMSGVLSEIDGEFLALLKGDEF